MKAKARRTKPPAKKKPPKAKRAAITRRRQAVAEAVLAGESVTAIARRQGRSRSEVSRDANAPETALILAEYLGRHKKQMIRLVSKSLAAIEKSFAAKRQGLTAAGKVVDCGADHYARLKGAEKALEVWKLAQPKEDARDIGAVTWEAFLLLAKAKGVA